MTALLPPPIVVVKVGGSLYDWPELCSRLREFVATLAGRSVVLVPGGGPFADVVRSLDSTQHLGDESAHWLTLRTLTPAAHFLARLVPGSKVIEGLSAARNSWMQGRVSVLDLFRFARGDESRPGHLPHTWDATTDSLAARVAHAAGAERLILLKSAAAPADWPATGGAGYVDALFAATVAAAPFVVEAVNLREWKN